jgi:hypothetical protein
MTNDVGENPEEKIDFALILKIAAIIVPGFLAVAPALDGGWLWMTGSR